MGIMDSIKNTVQSTSQSAGALSVISMLMNQGGGIQGLIQSFQAQGLGPIIQSWIGKGSNLPIAPSQLRSVIGEDKVNQMAEQSGMPSNDLLQKLSQYLPQVVDKLTPDGQVQSDRFSGSSLLNMGKDLFH